MLASKTITVSVLGLLLCGCSLLGPHLSDAKVGRPTAAAQSGEVLQLSGVLKSDGGAFKGLRIKLEGDVVARGFIATPAEATIYQGNAPRAETSKPRTVGLSRVGSDLEATIVNVDFDQPYIMFHVSAAVDKSGKGEVKLSIGPLDGGELSSVQYVLPCQVDWQAASAAKLYRLQQEKEMQAVTPAQ